MSHPTEFPPLSVESLQPLVLSKWLGRAVFVFDQLESTNTYALQMAEKGASHGTVIIAECQTAGKGRLGRGWYSPARTNIYSSVILTQKPTQPFISWIPLATGIAVAETIEEVSKLNVSLKWPNDLLFNTKKLGGVLCESTTKGPTGWVVIVGIGLNINCGENQFPKDLQTTATSLAIQAGHPFDRHVLLTTFFSKLESNYERVLDSDLPTLHANYVSRCSTLGRHIQVRLLSGKVVEGIASDIGDEGELHMIPSTPALGSINKNPSTISIRAGDIVHLR